MALLLRINKITFEKSENLQKISHKPEPCFFFKKKFMVFLKLPWRKQYLKILRKIQPNCITKP